MSVRLKDEFRELSDAFDSMLAQLEANVAEQQRFAANASHELRTPLAISRTLLDVARNDPTHDAGELIERLHAVNERAIDLTEALLPPKRSFPSPNSAGSRWTSPAVGPRPAAPPNSCREW